MEADFNSNLDGLDFRLWQRDPGVGTLGVLEANYGMGAPLSGASASLPEPSSFALIAVGLLGIGYRRRA